MEDWVWWMIAAGVLIAGEIFTLSFFLGPVGVAALSPAIVALLGAGIGGSGHGLHRRLGRLAARPAADRHPPPAGRRRGSGPAARRSSARTALVLERVDRDGGQVKIGGEVWTARAYDDDDVIEPGARVEVLKIDGATALVAE